MTIALLVLAAGSSQRFGADDKLMAPFAGEPLAVRTVHQAAACGWPVTVVVADPEGQVASALRQAGLAPPARIVANPRATGGIGTSIAAGIASLPGQTRAAIILQADMPLVTADLITGLAEAFARSPEPRPVHPVLPDGTQANPVLWPASWFARLATLDGDRGGKALLQGAAPLTIPIPDPLLAADVDTREDLARLASAMEAVEKAAGRAD